MKYKIVLSFLIAALSISFACAEVDMGVGFSPWDNYPYQKRQKTTRPDKFIRSAALYFGISETELVKLWNKGYGRNELIKLVLMSRESKQELPEIVKLREKNMRYVKIAEKYTVDYPKFSSEAETARKDIDYRVSVATFTIEISTEPEKIK